MTTDVSKATIDVDATPYVRRVLQAVSDISQRSFDGCRVADLGCAHGGYTNELARLGASAVGIEGRAAWLEHAETLKASQGLSTVFYQDDVRNFTKDNYGTFDVVLCLGLLYHMDSVDLVPLLRNIHEACSYYTVIQTHISLEATEKLEVDGKTY
jgi:2-polyprenyl-3-methyl-5-hydroxy-6-metoxy-1,4-benzoquinol methylase